ncbi:MAG: glutamate 5-kinase [Pseudomonadota bacterium]
MTEDPKTANAVRPEWERARRVVIKIGSGLVVDQATGQIRATWLNALADDIADLAQAGREIILVSSGSIALGRQLIGLNKVELELEESQAAAAVGQISLAHAYRDVFSHRGLTAALILLTLTDTEERRRYLNARRTIDTLLAQRALPVVNENDTVATTEIRYGDNDRLAARVASMVSADCLVLLSDIDGLYTAPPSRSKDAVLLPEVPEITPEIEAMAGGAASALSRGGMITKIEAAKIATAAGTHLVITSGRHLHPIRRLSTGEKATWFPAATDPIAARKRWIAGQLEPRGVLTIDAGAARALQTGKSLLPAGVTGLTGTFDRGDAVVIRTQDGREVGRGLVAYATQDAARIMGRRTQEIAGILGYTGRTALVHRDDMVLNPNRETTNERDDA